MKVIRWPELDILESDLKIVEGFYSKTNVGIMLYASLFPVSQLEKLKAIKKVIESQTKALREAEGLIYTVSRDFNA